MAMDDHTIQEMLDWLQFPTEDAPTDPTDLQHVVERAKAQDDVVEEQFTTAKHVMVDAIKSYEQMALILNLYYHACHGEPLLPVFCVDENPDSVQIHLENQTQNE